MICKQNFTGFRMCCLFDKRVIFGMLSSDSITQIIKRTTQERYKSISVLAFLFSSSCNLLHAYCRWKCSLFRMSSIRSLKAEIPFLFKFIDIVYHMYWESRERRGKHLAFQLVFPSRTSDPIRECE